MKYSDVMTLFASLDIALADLTLLWPSSTVQVWIAKCTGIMEMNNFHALMHSYEYFSCFYQITPCCFNVSVSENHYQLQYLVIGVNLSPPEKR